MKRVFRELGHDNLCVATPFVELSNGQRILEEMSDYPVVSTTRALAGDWIVDAAASQQTKVAATGKKTYQTSEFKLVIDATSASADAKVYLGMGQKGTTGVEGIEILPTAADVLEGVTIGGTFGTNTLKQLTTLAYKDGHKIKNIRATAKTGAFYDTALKYTEHTPIGSILKQSDDLYFSEPTAKDVDKNVRTMAGFTGEFNGYNHLYFEVPKTEKVTLTFEFEMMF